MAPPKLFYMKWLKGQYCITACSRRTQLAWSIIQRLSRTGLFIPILLISCWLLTLREWVGGVEHLEKHFSEKLNIGESRMQQCKELVKAQTAARRICLITLIRARSFSCTYIVRAFSSIQSPLIPMENFPQVSELLSGATEMMSPRKETTLASFLLSIIYIQKVRSIQILSQVLSQVSSLTGI